MEKRILILATVFLSLLLVFVVFADEPEQIVLSEGAFDVQTNSGEVDLSEGTVLVDEGCEEYLYLGETREFQTTNGAQNVTNGTVICCEQHAPGVQNPCDPF